jgi:hypothetical protein
MNSLEKIKSELSIRLQEAIIAAKKSAAPPLAPAPSGAGFDPNHIVIGRTGLVNRIRGGKLQWRHLVSEQQGFKILDGSLVKMTPQEMRHRRIAARIGARKRSAEIAQITRRRNLSLVKRDVRLNAYTGV